MRSIAAAIRDVLDVEEDLLEIDPYRRVRVLVDVTKPLKCTQKIRLKGNQIVNIGLKYERLPHFCFLCWSLNIKASPRKGLSKFKEEVDALKGKGRTLFTPKPPITHKPYAPPCVATDEGKKQAIRELKLLIMRLMMGRMWLVLNILLGQVSKTLAFSCQQAVVLVGEYADNSVPGSEGSFDPYLAASCQAIKPHEQQIVIVHKLDFDMGSSGSDPRKMCRNKKKTSKGFV